MPPIPKKNNTHPFSWLLLLGIPLASLILFLWVGIPSKTRGTFHAGVTFSQTYATSLGLNWRETLTATLDELGVRQFRIPVYWSIVEPVRDHYEWSSIDFQMDEIARRNGKVLLAIGLKLPRWPECWMPEWAKNLPVEEEHAQRIKYLTAAVERYKDHPALETWQVENEAGFLFGICPPPDRNFHKQEIEHVRTLDPNHPIATTDSGELSTWIPTGSLVDSLGISVYRIVRLPWGSVWTYDWIPPYWYARRAALVSPWVTHLFVSEFQMEPWVEKSITETPVEEQFETFDISRMEKNFAFAERMHFDEVYFWGVEWWWWMKVKHNDHRFWDQASVFFHDHP